MTTKEHGQSRQSRRQASASEVEVRSASQAKDPTETHRERRPEGLSPSTRTTLQLNGCRQRLLGKPPMGQTWRPEATTTTQADCGKVCFFKEIPTTPDGAKSEATAEDTATNTNYSKEPTRGGLTKIPNGQARGTKIQRLRRSGHR